MWKQFSTLLEPNEAETQQELQKRFLNPRATLIWMLRETCGTTAAKKGTKTECDSHPAQEINQVLHTKHIQPIDNMNWHLSLEIYHSFQLDIDKEFIQNQEEK